MNPQKVIVESFQSVLQQQGKKNKKKWLVTVISLHNKKKTSEKEIFASRARVIFNLC